MTIFYAEMMRKWWEKLICECKSKQINIIFLQECNKIFFLIFSQTVNCHNKSHLKELAKYGTCQSKLSKPFVYYTFSKNELAHVLVSYSSQIPPDIQRSDFSTRFY